jgi:hypothetical protein
MAAGPHLNRRKLFRRVLEILAWSRIMPRAVCETRSPEPSVEIDRLACERSGGARASQSRHYRAHAVITLFSVPLFSKDNVGGGWVMAERLDADASHTTVLQFAAGSWPGHLKGFNRFGMTQEAVRKDGSVVVESAYLSFMTASAEKSLEQARKSYGDRSATLPITVAHGASGSFRYQAVLDRLSAPSHYTWADCSRLLKEIRGRLSPAVDAAVDGNREGALQPFLHAVRSAMTGGPESGETEFVHNARLYRLRTALTATREGMLLTGRISECQSDRTESEFRVWFDAADEARLPERIEFRPKSFLRLVFEHDPAASEPTFPSLIQKEPA